MKWYLFEYVQVLSHEGSLRKQDPKGSIWVSYVLSSPFHEVYLKCRFPTLKLKCQNVLSPEGSLRKQNPKVTIWVSYVLSSPFHVGYLKSQFPPLKLKCPNVLFCGWMDGWMGGLMDGWVDGWVGGDILPLSIFFFFKYNNKQQVLIPKVYLNVASTF